MNHDVTLLERFARARDEDAFAELVRRHVDAIYSFAVRRVNGDARLAEEVVQDVFIVLARQAASVARHPVLIGWLFRTTRNVAANAVRAESRRRRREEELEQMDPTNTRHETEWSELAPLLDDALDTLGETDRSAVLLRFMQRKTFAEVGESLGLAEDAARKRVDRAIGKLHATLVRRGFASSAALAATLSAHAVIPAPAGLAASSATAALTALGPTGSVVAGSATTFMASAKILGAGAALLLLIAVGRFGVGQRQEWIQARRLTAALQARSRETIATATRPDVMNATEESAGASTKHGQMSAAFDPSIARQSATPAAKPGAKPTEPAPPSAVLRQACHDARQAALRLELMQLRSMTLTREEIDRLANLGAAIQPEEDIGISDLSQIYADQALFAKFRTTVEPELGAARFAQLQEAMRAAPADYLAGDVSADMAQVDPLRPEQFDALRRTIARASRSYQSGGGVDTATLDWESLLRNARGFLSPAQYESLNDLRATLLYRDAINRIRDADGA